MIVKPRELDYHFVSNSIDPNLLLAHHNQQKEFSCICVLLLIMCLVLGEDASLACKEEDDEFALVAKFTLPKGVYATELLSFISNGGFV